ncbi:MAG: glycosyltransferase [Lachnospiraceae bacterium]|nr:glycosyltransferase [Lachnospiraceae bacterium]
MQPDVSVIMPVYNSREHLPSAIESVLAQTHKNFELILVDDGSTDGCAGICDDYAKRDGRVRVIHKSNGGISSARNAGVRAACGEYLAFCDNDDKYLPDLIRDNYALAKEYDADVIRFKRLKIAYKENGRQIKTSDRLTKFAVLKGEGIAKEYFALVASYVAVWSGLYRRSMVMGHQIRFPECMKFGQEDAWFNYGCYENASCIVLNPRIYYYWIQREEHSTTGKFNVNLIASMVTNMKREWKLLEKLDVERYQKDCYYLRLMDWIQNVFTYMNQKKCPYHIWQKAGMLRFVCKQVPDKSKIRVIDKDRRIRDAVVHNNGFYLYFMFRGMGLEW